MDQLFRAIETFFDQLTAISWGPLALALCCQLGKVLARTRSWRNILAASYPETRVRWRSVFGAYVAGVGVNAVLPVRGGDVLKLYLIKHRITGSTYPTLAATLLVETLFDFVIATCLLIWALQQGVLPSLDVLPRLPSIDWLWLFRRPLTAAIALGVAVLFGFVLGIWASRRVEAFQKRVAQGFAILRPPRRYLVGVVPWQTLDWMFRLATVYFFLQAFGLHADLHNALLVQVTQSLSTVLPLTPGGIGTEQALLVYVFSGTAPASTVLSFSVGMKLALVAFNVVLGFGAILLMLRTFRWRDVVDRDGAVSEPGEPTT
jgi:glycosyltransferase 2 family protein